MKDISKKWWFAVSVIVISLIILIGIITLKINNSKTNPTSNNNADHIKQIENERKEYEETQDYNGTYKFSLSDDNGSGYTFNAIGAITFNGNECKIKFNRTKTKSTTEDIELEGTCGLNKEDRSVFYFTIYTNNNSEVSTYRCSKSEDILICELKSKYNLVGCNINKELDLTYVNNNKDIDSVFSEILEEEKLKKEIEQNKKKEQEEKEFKDSCKVYTFEQIARNPNNFKGTNVKVTGEVIQALYGTNTVDLRINITKKGSYSTYYTDTIYVTYTPSVKEDKILEDDIITVYGTSQGDYSYTSTMGSKITLPLIFGKYITIEK